MRLARYLGLLAICAICLTLWSCAAVNVSGLADAAMSGDMGRLKAYGSEYLSKRQKATLSLADIEPRFADTPLELVEFEGVEYIYLGIPEYDDYFRSAARLDGLVQISKRMTTSATGNLKKYAMSKAASAAMQENVEGLVGDKPAEEWTSEEQIAVMKMANEKGQITSDEREYFVRTAGLLTIVSVSLVKGIDAAYDLTKSGMRLKDSATLTDTEAVIAAEGFAASLKNLESVADNGPPMVEEMAVLVSGFRALGN